ncbi:hypothetical protein HRbin36_01039 [bacterium HR36]|nr:hypothetical protein HRbin36_01039 [bacterium HR36]
MKACSWRMNQPTQHSTAGKWTCLLVIACVAGCQQLPGTRSPLKPTRNSNDPFLGSPVSRIPPTPVPPMAGAISNEPRLGMGPTNGIVSTNMEIRASDRNYAPPATRNADGVQVATWQPSPDRSKSWEEVFRQLRSKGITWQKLEMQGNLWRFECTIPNPEDPNQTREYYATAPDPLSAVQAVLQKLDAAR